jgi:hypothetical protein
MGAVQDMRRAQGLSMQTIILAALGIVILIVLIAVFTGKIRFFSSNVGGSCTEQGGKCSPDGSCSSVEGKPIKIWAQGCTCHDPDSTGVCKGKTEKGIGQCCLPIGR